MDMIGLRNKCIGAAVAVFALAAGCENKYEPAPIPPPGSSSSSGGGDMGGSGGAGGGGSGGGGSGGLEGFPPDLPPCDFGKNVVLAVDKLFLGDTERDGTPNPTSGWKQYGFNLDGRASTKTSTDLCQPSAGGSKAAVYPDGNNGIDNSFGKNILPIILGLASDLSTVTNEAIANGEYTILLSIDNVGGQSCTTSSALFLGDNLGMPPFWNGSDVWPIDPTSLNDPMDPFTPKTIYPKTLMFNGFVGMTPPSQVDLVLTITGVKIRLPIRRASMLLELAPDNQTATGGTIGGIIDKEELVNEIAKVAAAFDQSFCDPNSPTLVSILNQMRQAADIMIDGSQDPMRECDGISIGLGFTMRSVQLGPVAPFPPPPPDPCMP